jgi:hypothetical protein
MTAISKYYVIKEARDKEYVVYHQPYKYSEFSSHILKAKKFNSYEEALTEAIYYKLDFFQIEHYYENNEELIDDSDF